MSLCILHVGYLSIRVARRGSCDPGTQVGGSHRDSLAVGSKGAYFDITSSSSEKQTQGTKGRSEWIIND